MLNRHPLMVMGRWYQRKGPLGVTFKRRTSSGSSTSTSCFRCLSDCMTTTVLDDKAGNRLLHYDQYCLMVLVFLFNPICSSLRAAFRKRAN